VEDANEHPLYHITIKCVDLSSLKSQGDSSSSSLSKSNGTLSSEEYKAIEEEFRSFLLRLAVLDSQFTHHPPGK
jgi:hypothetical protein